MADPDTGFFPCFAPDGIFEGFAGLKEAGEGAVEGGGPTRLAAEDYLGGGLLGRGQKERPGEREG